MSSSKQMTIMTTAQKIADEPANLLLVANSYNSVFIGSSGVTIADGFLLLANQYPLPVPVGALNSLWVIGTASAAGGILYVLDLSQL